VTGVPRCRAGWRLGWPHSAQTTFTVPAAGSAASHTRTFRPEEIKLPFG